MKNYITVIYIIAICAVIFRKYIPRIPTLEELNSLFPIVSRIIYFAFGMLWIIANENNFIISTWDAERINVPITAYLGFPAFALFLYAILPNLITWLFVIAIFTTIWALHIYRTLTFAFIHMNGSLEGVMLLLLLLIYSIILFLCVSILYVFGPFIQNNYRKNKINQKSDE